MEQKECKCFFFFTFKIKKKKGCLVKDLNDGTDILKWKELTLIVQII